MRTEPDERLAREFEALIDDPETLEPELQRFLERHTEFIPTTTILNHRVHMNCVITKFPIGGRTADFAYLTKSSDQWWLVLIEIERASKKLFTDSSDHVGNTADFNEAVAQIDVWRDYWENNRHVVRDMLVPILVPPRTARNPIRLKRILVIGRSAEKDAHAGRRARLAGMSDEMDTHIMTWDTILRLYRDGNVEKRCILSTDVNGYRIKRVDGMPVLLFACVMPEHLTVSREAEALLKADGYQIDLWRNNQPLVFNDKWATTPDADEADGLHWAARAVIESATKSREKLSRSDRGGKGSLSPK